MFSNPEHYALNRELRDTLREHFFKLLASRDNPYFVTIRPTQETTTEALQKAISRAHKRLDRKLIGKRQLLNLDPYWSRTTIFCFFEHAERQAARTGRLHCHMLVSFPAAKLYREGAQGIQRGALFKELLLEAKGSLEIESSRLRSRRDIGKALAYATKELHRSANYESFFILPPDAAGLTFAARTA